MNRNPASASSQPKVSKPWLTDSRWSSNTFHAKSGEYWLNLKTLPGIIGGRFTAYIDGLQPDKHGQAQIAIMCTTVESSRNHDGTQSAVAVTDFLEIESKKISGPRVDFEFLIPIEATCLTEGATWTLDITFSNGVNELFEIPVYRTYQSNSELTALKIASINSSMLDDSSRQSLIVRSAYSLSVDDNLYLQLPTRVNGKPGLFKGLAIFVSLWATVGIFLMLSAGFKDGPWFFLIPIPFLTLILLFLYKGNTTIMMDEYELSVKHNLFGLGVPFTIKRDNIAGFSSKCLGAMPSDKGPMPAYMLGIQKHEYGFKILSPALLSQWDSRLLTKRLSEFWNIK